MILYCILSSVHHCGSVVVWYIPDFTDSDTVLNIEPYLITTALGIEPYLITIRYSVKGTGVLTSVVSLHIIFL